MVRFKANVLLGFLTGFFIISISGIFQYFSIHLKLEDKLVVRIGRDGGLQQFELSGLLTLRITDENLGRIKVQLQNDDTHGIQLQTHPNVDKELFKTRSIIGLKNPTKPFPLNTDVGVLKWRFVSLDDSAIPLTSREMRNFFLLVKIKF